MRQIPGFDFVSKAHAFLLRLPEIRPFSFFYRHPILFAAITFLISRWFIVFHNNGYIYNTAGEELIYSTIAAERLRGNEAVSQMVFQEYTSGGFWLQTYLYMPIISLLGCSRYALKLLPILFSLGGFVSFLYLAFTWFGKRAGFFFAVFYILANPLFLTHQVVGYANHNELGLFFGICLILFFNLSFNKSITASSFSVYAGLLGLISGLSIFYCYSAIPFVCLLGLVLPIAFFKRYHDLGLKVLPGLPALLIGFFLGIGAISLLKSRIGHPVFGYYSQTGSALNTIGLFWQKVSFLSFDWFHSFFFEMLPRVSCFGKDWIDYVYFLLVFAPIVILAVALFLRFLQWIGRTKEIKETFPRLLQPNVAGLLLFIFAAVVYSAAFFLQGEVAGWDPTKREPFGIQPLQYHQMVVFMPFIFMLSALFCSWLLESKKNVFKWFICIYIVTMLFFGIESIKQSTSETPERIDLTSCVSYKSLANAAIDGTKASYSADQQCDFIFKQVKSWDPDGQETACQIIQDRMDCPPCTNTEF